MKYMKQKQSGLFLVIFVGFLTQSLLAETEANPNKGWALDARFLPLPSAASEEAQQAMIVSPRPLVPELSQVPPKTNKGWLAIQTASNVSPLSVMEEYMAVSITKHEIANVPVYKVIPNKVLKKHQSFIFLHFHPGGYVLTGGDAAPGEAALISGAIGIEAVSVDYRMSPLHPFPAALEDAVAVYKALRKRYPASAILMGGSSAGGGLVLATVHKLKALGLELPGAVWVGTPWADLTKTGDTLFTNQGVDRVLMNYDGMMAAMAKLYAGEHDLKDSLISPVYGVFDNFPATQLVTGTRDLFLSDTVRVHRKMRRAGVDAELHVLEGFSHAEYLMVPGSPETLDVLRELDGFIGRTLKVRAKP